MPRKIVSTLTLSNSNSVYTSIFIIFLYRLCAIATPRHLNLSYLENYIRIVVFGPNLRTAFHSVLESYSFFTTAPPSSSNDA